MFFYAFIGFNDIGTHLVKTCSQSDHDTSIWYHRWVSIKTKFTATPPHQPPHLPPPFFRSQATLGLPIFYCSPLHLWACSQARFLRTDWELKQKRRRRLRERLFKSKVALLQKLYRAYSTSFNSSNVGNFFLDLNSKNLYQSSGKENESRCRVFTSSTQLEIWAFLRRCHAVTAKKRTKKRDSTCKVVVLPNYWNLLLFWRSHWRRRLPGLNSLLPHKTWACEQRSAYTLLGSCVPTYQTRPLVSRPQLPQR